MDIMDLSERKKKILQAIIDEYIGTAEPVGSRAISKKQELGLSSATIRNEMADLEEMGYLLQPHTSAGRVPSDSGYRFYVNQLMQRYQLGMEAIARLQEQLHARVNQLDRIIRSAGLAASALTDYTTFVTTPGLNEAIINKIDLVYVGERKIMLILVTETVRSRTMNVAMSAEECGKAADFLNERLKGLKCEEVTAQRLEELRTEAKTKLPSNDDTFVCIIHFIYDMITEDDGSEIYVHNAKSLLRYPEYSDVGKAQKMFELLEDKSALKHLMAEANTGNDVRATIGMENQSELLNDCSLVTVNYSLDGKHVGKLGVLGPKRMNYAKVFASLDLIAQEIDKLLKEI
jgi:heat-inducible transcriptional repressor